MDVRESALKHGSSADDIRHAITNALVAYDDLDDPYALYLGPDTAGTLLEVLTAVDDQGEESPSTPCRCAASTGGWSQ